MSAFFNSLMSKWIALIVYVWSCCSLLPPIFSRKFHRPNKVLSNNKRFFCMKMDYYDVLLYQHFNQDHVSFYTKTISKRAISPKGFFSQTCLFVRDQKLCTLLWLEIRIVKTFKFQVIFLWKYSEITMKIFRSWKFNFINI